MKNCSLFCAGWWPFLVLPLLVLFLFSIFQWRSVEDDIQGQAQQVVGAQGWAQAETYNRGRELLITGAAPSQAVRDSLEEELKLQTNARTIEFVGGIAEAKPLRNSSISADWTRDSVILNGEVANQTIKSKIVADANAAYGADRVVDQLQISNDVQGFSINENIFEITRNLNNGAKLTISDAQLALSGVVASDQIKTQIGSAVSQSFTGRVLNNLTVNVPKPVIVAEEANNQCISQVAEMLTSSKIVFASGKAEIDSQSDELLQNISQTMTACPEANFEVSGHTDSSGNYDYNVGLSEQRAQAVVDRLVQLQMERDRFTVRGYGPDQPIADNDTDAGMAQNRRIEFNLSN